MKNKILILGLTLFSNLLIATDDHNSKQKVSGIFAETLGVISQTKPVCWYNQNISPIIRPSFGTEAASEKYQNLGKEAQVAVGVPADRILPIKKIMPCFSGLVAAIAEPDAIYIDENLLESRDFGRQRATLFHESCHVKYNDLATKGLIGWSTILTSSLLAHKTIKTFKPVGKYKFLRAAGVLTASGATGYMVPMQYSKFMERRADFEGHHALQCATCVKESAQTTQALVQSGHPLMGHGYLSSSELASIGTEFEKQNKKCATHK